MPATLTATTTKTELGTQVLEALKLYGALNVAQLKAVIPDARASQLIQVVSDLRTNRLVTFNRRLSAFILAEEQELIQRETQNSIPAKESAPPKFKEITLRVSPGLHNALRQYARLQETSIESEAQHLLAEIVRMYQHTNVIPT